MRGRARVRPPRWVWWVPLLAGTAVVVFVLIFFSRTGAAPGPAGYFLFLVPAVLVALVGLVGVLRGRLPGMYYDVEFEELADPEDESG